MGARSYFSASFITPPFSHRRNCSRKENTRSRRFRHFRSKQSVRRRRNRHHTSSFVTVQLLLLPANVFEGVKRRALPQTAAMEQNEALCPFRAILHTVNLDLTLLDQSLRRTTVHASKHRTKNTPASAAGRCRGLATGPEIPKIATARFQKKTISKASIHVQLLQSTTVVTVSFLHKEVVVGDVSIVLELGLPAIRSGPKRKRQAPYAPSRADKGATQPSLR